MELAQLTRRKAERSSSLTLRLILGLWRMWAHLKPRDWWDDGATTAVAGRGALLVDRALTQARNESGAYVRSFFRGQRTELLLPRDTALYPRSGVTPAEVYERPAKEYRWVTSQGASHAEALEQARTRLEEIAEADVARAISDAEQQFYSRIPAVIGYRRVVHPELSRGGVCGLCLAAATRFYTVGELLPIHDRCACGTAPITAADDPGIRLNRDDLDRLYAQAGSTSAADLSRVRVREVVHGELGPLLTREGHNWKGPAESGSAAYRKPTFADEVAKWERQLAVSEQMADAIGALIRDGQATGQVVFQGRDMRISDSASALKYHRGLITKYREKLVALAA